MHDGARQHIDAIYKEVTNATPRCKDYLDLPFIETVATNITIFVEEDVTLPIAESAIAIVKCLVPLIAAEQRDVLRARADLAAKLREVHQTRAQIPSDMLDEQVVSDAQA